MDEFAGLFGENVAIYGPAFQPPRAMVMGQP